MILEITDKSDLYAIGDIHGDFKAIVYKINTQYNIKNSILIVCGDIGFGFHKKGYYDRIMVELNVRLKKNNNLLIFFRGNHDNPEYFNDKINHSNIKAVSDYSVINIMGDEPKSCLLVGGAISIDRVARVVNVSYWSDEIIVYDENKLNEITNNHKITHVFTHSNPDFCEPHTKEGILGWSRNDAKLFDDCDTDRKTHTKLYDYLINNNHPIKAWTNGHYHFSKVSYINNIKFQTLDIGEITPIN